LGRFLVFASVIIFAAIVITASVLAFRNQKFKEDKLKELWKAVDATGQQEAAMRQLIALDLQAKDSNNRDLARRLEKAKRLIANRQRGQCFLLAAIASDAKPKAVPAAIQVYFYNELGDGKALYVLNHQQREIAGGSIPAETIGGEVKVPCGWLFLYLHPHTAAARRDFVSGNEIDMREGVEDIAFIQIRDKSGARRDVVGVTKRNSLKLKPAE